MIPARIGRKANPDGLVVHVRAMPTNRLLDVRTFERDGDEHQVGTLDLEPEESGVLFVLYDGDSGKLIDPFEQLRKAQRSTRRVNVLGVVGIVIVSMSLALNVALLLLNIMSGRLGRVLLNLVCVGVCVFALSINLRTRKNRDARLRNSER